MTTIARTARTAPSDLPAYVEGADLTAHDIDRGYASRLRRLTDAELAAEVRDVEAETERWKERIAAYLRPSLPAVADAVAGTSTRLTLPLSEARPVTRPLVGLVDAYNEAHSRLIEARSEQAQRG